MKSNLNPISYLHLLIYNFVNLAPDHLHSISLFLNEQCTICKKNLLILILKKKRDCFVINAHNEQCAHLCILVCLFLCERLKLAHSQECKGASVWARTHVQIHPAAQVKITHLLCPVSITNKPYTEEDWTGTAGHVVVWCASVLLLSLSSGCVISRVCMWAFSFLHVIHCVSVLSMPSECCVCVVVCGLILFLFVLFFFFYCVYWCYSLPHGPSPWQTKAHSTT